MKFLTSINNSIPRKERNSFSLDQINMLKNSKYSLLNFAKVKTDLLPPFQSVTQMQMATRQEGAYASQKVRGSYNLLLAYEKFYEDIFSLKFETGNFANIKSIKNVAFKLFFAGLSAGDEILFPNPGNKLYANIAKQVGAKVIYYTLNEQEKWCVNFQELKKKDLEKVKMMWADFPKFPVGSHHQISEIRQIIEFCKENNIILINNNSHNFILNESPQSIFKYGSINDRVIELFSFAETFNIGGWQIGMMVANDSFINDFISFENQIDEGVSLPFEEGVINALKYEIERNFIGKNNYQYQNRKEKMLQFFEAIGCTLINENCSGGFLWAKILANKKTSIRFSEELLKKYSIFVQPGTDFGSAGEGYIFVTLFEVESKIEEALNRLKIDH
ncbi:aminotransferase class I/II-fold pyridoxal phosphate-dependent enzyme [Mesonia aquimarina]|uniref:aminotransferase class I/II-fold pyridoxal phosphate-dependent enzyme n=1 Tax=Mesonia aquimarina TaxID=1504967 RepID=UPI0013CE413A|nr:pyridoxal phosphate-dependent aminotransferase [Mesonia aquimarina]